MIETENLTVTLPSRAGDVNILRGIDLSIAAGERSGLSARQVRAKPPAYGIGRIGAADRRFVTVGSDYGAMSEDDLARFRAPISVLSFKASTCADHDGIGNTACLWNWPVKKTAAPAPPRFWTRSASPTI